MGIQRVAITVPISLQQEEEGQPEEAAQTIAGKGQPEQAGQTRAGEAGETNSMGVFRKSRRVCGLQPVN